MNLRRAKLCKRQTMVRHSQCSIVESALHVARLWAELRCKGDTKVGAAVIHESGNIFLGYNGFPPGITDADSIWSTPDKHDYVIHAEINAMRKAIGALGNPLHDCVLVCTMLPCISCLREIVSNRIKQIYFECDNANLLKKENKKARAVLEKQIKIGRIMPSMHIRISHDI